jgi:hypothetical protein
MKLAHLFSGAGPHDSSLFLLFSVFSFIQSFFSAKQALITDVLHLLWTLQGLGYSLSALSPAMQELPCCHFFESILIELVMQMKLALDTTIDINSKGLWPSSPITTESLHVYCARCAPCRAWATACQL